MPSFLCLLTGVVKTHSLRACLGQSHVQISYVLLVLTTHCLLSSWSVPDTSTLASQCPGPNVCPPGQPPCQPQTSPTLPYVWCQSFSSGQASLIYHGRHWGKDLPKETGLCSDLGGKPKTDSFPTSAVASALRHLPCS